MLFAGRRSAAGVIHRFHQLSIYHVFRDTAQINNTVIDTSKSRSTVKPPLIRSNAMMTDCVCAY